MTGSKDPKAPTDPNWESAAASATIKTVMTKPKTGNAPSRGIFSVLKGPQAGRILSLPIGQVLTLAAISREISDALHRHDSRLKTISEKSGKIDARTRDLKDKLIKRH